MRNNLVEREKAYIRNKNFEEDKDLELTQKEIIKMMKMMR